MKQKGFKNSLFSLLVLAAILVVVISSCSVNKTGKAFSWDAGVDQNIYNLAALASSGKAGTFSFVADSNSDIQALSPLTAALGIEDTLRSSEVTTQKDLIIVSTDSSVKAGEAIMTLDTADGTKLYLLTSSAEGTSAAVNALLSYKDHPQLKSTKVKVLADGSVQEFTGVPPVVGNTATLTVKSFDSVGKVVIADVYVDDVLKGKTPLTLEGVASGTYAVQVKLAGYEDSEKRNIEIGITPVSQEFNLVQLVKKCLPDYSECTTTVCGSDSKQTRTCTDKNNCGESARAEIVDCTYIAPCTSDWQKASVGECQPNGAQTVTYSDANKCDPNHLTKTESQQCTYVPPCQTTWNVESEGACDAETQTKKVTYVDSCDATKKDVKIQSCSYTCTEKDWTCEGSIDAVTCKYDEKLERKCTSTVKTCADSNTAKPKETYLCVPKCVENWESKAAEECRSDGTQGINWVDSNNCGTAYKKPVETSQKCTYVSTQGTVGFKSYDGVTVYYGLQDAKTPKTKMEPSVYGKEGLIEYVIPNLEPGTYDLVTELDGYEPDTRTVLVEKGKTTDAGEIKLSPLISTAFKNIKDKKQFDSFTLVIGAFADPSDNIGALDVAGGHRISKTVLDIDTKVDVYTKNMIVIGGPCANFEAGRLLGKFVDEKYYWTQEGKASAKCAEGFEEGKGFVQIFKEDETIKIIIAGYSATDTRRLAKAIKKILENADRFKGKRIEVCGESLDETRYDCKDFKINYAKKACLRDKGQWTGETCKCVEGKEWNGKECVVPAPTVITGSLTIKSDPEGAKIYINDVLKTEVTSAVYKDLKPGSYKIKLSKSGYKSQTFTQEVKAGDNEVLITLVKSSGVPPPPPPPPPKP